MKDNKKRGWLLGMVCLTLCLCLCFAACGGDNDTTEPSETAGTTTPVETTEATVPSTAETTLPAEETTAPSEATEPTGNSKPGGSGGYNPGTTQPTTPNETVPDETQPEVEVGEPGTENNPYYEAVNDLPGSFTTVNIPANQSVCYLIHTEGKFLNIEDGDASVELGETVYTAENGVVTVSLEDMETPVSVKVVNNGAEEKAFAVNVVGAVGTASNPEILTSVAQIQVELAEGAKGHFYSWTADRTGLLLFGFDSVLPENVAAELTVIVNGEEMILNSVDQNVLWAYVTEGESITVGVSAVADENGNYPAAQIAVSTLFVPRVEMEITEIPTTIETEVLPVGGIAYYMLSGVADSTITIYTTSAVITCNDITYSPDEFGTIQIDMATVDTAELIICNFGEEETAFALEIAYGETGPQEVMVGDTNVAYLGENDENAFFTWTAYLDGTLKLTMDIDNISGWYMQVTNVTTGELVGQINSDGIDNYICADVKEGDVLEVQVNTHMFDSEETPAGEVAFGAAFVSGSGTQEDPYSILGADVNIHVGAGETVYATGRFSGMIANVYGDNVTIANNGNDASSDWGYASLEITGGDFFTPPVFTLTNIGEAATYNIVFTYPLGSSANPEELMVGTTSTAVLEANDEDGYFYQYTSYVDGILKITMDPENETEWFFAVENRTQGVFGEWHYSDSDPLVTSESIAVQAGDVIVIQVNTYNSADMWDLPAGEVSFDSSFVSGSGTQEDPYSILGLDADITIEASQTVYCTGRFSGMIAEIYGENVTIENDGKTADSSWGFASLEITGGDFFTPPVFTLTNTGETATYNVLITYPLGSSENPQEILIGAANTATLQANDADGYFFMFEAYCDGVLKITMDPENETEWFFAVENRTQGVFGDWHYSDSDPLVTSETVAVKTGDIIVVQVNTYNSENMWESPAGEVSFDVSLVSGSGTQEDPYTIQGLDFDIPVGAGQTVYCSGRFSGMVLNLVGDNATVSCNGETASSVEGAASCLITGGDMWTPPVFTITNSGEETVYNINIAYPIGSMDNPDTLQIGQNSVSFKAESSEYFLVWQAPSAGTLTITMDSGNSAGWQFTVNNMTNYHYGDHHVSAGDPLVNSESITVNAGDEVLLQLCTFDPNNPWVTPAGEISYTVTFTPAN